MNTIADRLVQDSKQLKRISYIPMTNNIAHVITNEESCPRRCFKNFKEML